MNLIQIRMFYQCSRTILMMDTRQTCYCICLCVRISTFELDAMLLPEAGAG